jgi:dTDP-4-amino-4,6-dideoxygalactose transaminase
MKIPFNSFATTHPQMREEAIKTFENFYDSQYYVLGNMVKNFEKQYAELNQTKHCIGVANGLDALHIALKVLGIGKGDEVIVPSNTYIATVLAVSFVGAKPVFVEPNLYSYNLNPDLLEGAITKNTKAIMPVHLYGQACEMDKIMEIAIKYNLFVIEDNAQAHLATYHNKLTGSFGHINATSFYPTKNLGALGDAGAITTDNAKWAIDCMTYRNYGSQKRYYNEVIGLNSRLDELQAGLLSDKLKYLELWTSDRQRIAKQYLEELQILEDNGSLILPQTVKNATHVYHLFVIRTKKRNELQQFLTDNGIGSLIHYPIPPHLQEAYKHLGYQKGDFPIAEEIAETCLSLPMYPYLTQEQVSEVCNTIKEFYLKHN